MAKETFEKIENFLKGEKIDWQSIHLWIQSKGYVIVTEEQYNNLTVIDENGAVP